ncbi:enhanced serine sensitivity protein SseB [Streptomyces sp. 3MP-14]|uniref:Enhanced serine sensitivity protein SseB n=1 Tax=Streptomyces mimosae TaxID=2586635 RepID=A0A5N6AD03_9ACTN|nr:MULTISPECIES: enhanced serine sensitivity protein SseB [Streptomyces]KAB8165846.1 enhanced serine sensitivity protein SseB [Streptomyces mimosae]KAB8176235.1 enhanced serine sensitivity protein SseB [Streptomyces sp. 3MP-14]
MSVSRTGPGFGGGWPGNELEEALAASVGVPDAAPRLLKLLSRSAVWVPLPEGGGPESRTLDLPTIDLAGGVYVPVFSSAEQLHLGGASHLPFTVAPAWEFARGLPPQVGIAVNPGGTVGIPVPPVAVAELCRATPGERTPGVPSGARMRLFQPDWQDDPVEFLNAAAEELGTLWYVVTARRGLASAEGGEPALFVGVELDQVDDTTREAVNAALGRALARHTVRWPVQLVLLDAAQDPVVDWLRECVAPFYSRGA